MSRLLERLRTPVPPPPESLRRGPFRDGAFTAPARSERTTSLLGIALAAAFGVCFLTGLVSHFVQHPNGWTAGWTAWPTRPVSLYRVTQGVHVATGIAAVPLLLAKLWSVYPRLFRWPPVRDAADGLSRLGLLVLVGAAVFQLSTGLVDIARWYAVLPFFFTVAHYWTAWIAVGALLVHVAAKLPVVRAALARPRTPAPPAVPAGGLGRRGLLGAVGASVGVLTLATVGQTVPWLSAVSRLAPRLPRVGPQGVPVNKSASGAGVTTTARDPGYRLTVVGTRTVELSLEDLRALPQHTARLPIACVEGWSSTADWTGPRLSDVLALASARAADGQQVHVESLQQGGLYRASDLPASFAEDPRTLLALRLGGEVLHIDHGYPVRLIAPNRPGVLQTKWVSRLEVTDV